MDSEDSTAAGGTRRRPTASPLTSRRRGNYAWPEVESFLDGRSYARARRRVQERSPHRTARGSVGVGRERRPQPRTPPGGDDASARARLRRGRRLRPRRRRCPADRRRIDRSRRLRGDAPPPSRPRRARAEPRRTRPRARPEQDRAGERVWSTAHHFDQARPGSTTVDWTLPGGGDRPGIITSTRRASSGVTSRRATSNRSISTSPAETATPSSRPLNTEYQYRYRGGWIKATVSTASM